MQQKLDPVASKTYFTHCIVDVAPPLRVFFPVGDNREDSHGSCLTFEQAETGRNDTGGAQYACLHCGQVTGEYWMTLVVDGVRRCKCRECLARGLA